MTKYKKMDNSVIYRIILGRGPVNGRRRYRVASPFIGGAHAQNDPEYVHCFQQIIRSDSPQTYHNIKCIWTDIEIIQMIMIYHINRSLLKIQ